MIALSPFLSITSPCEETLQVTRAKLSEAGLSTVQTFNLKTARLGLHDCCCPNHGTGACDCQMIILLVYGEISEPATLVLHGYNGQTWVSIPESAVQQGEAKLVGRIRNVLEGIRRETVDC